MPKCQNCGSGISKKYARVFTPEGVDQPRACPFCEDMIRSGGKVRETRATRHNNDTEPVQYDPEKHTEE